MQALGHYRHPFLAAQRVVVSTAEPGQLELVDGTRSLKLTIEAGDVDAAREMLEQLRRPDSECWRELCQRRDPGLLALLDRLDRLGWLRDADHSGHDQLSRETDDVEELIRQSTAWLVNAAPCVEAVSVDHGYAGTLLQFANEATLRLRGSSSRSLGLSPGAGARGERDIAAIALSLMFDRWQRTSPCALWITNAALRGAVNHFDIAQCDEPPDLGETAPTLGDPRTLRKQVWSALALAVLSAARRYRTNYAAFVPPGDLSGPGLNILTTAEAAAERLMAARGPSTLLQLIDRGVKVHRVAVGVYLHQYFITIRYIEAVYAFLQHNLRADLKTAATRYLLEEIGHEVHEFAACRELGISAQEIDDFAPLPFFSAYPEVLGAVAQVDPLAFCLAISVAEGLPGANKPIAAALAERGIVGNSFASHQRIDERLDHALVTRQLMRHVPWVKFATARDAIELFLFIVELSQLCWQQLANYSGSSEFPAVPVAFELSASELLATFR